MKDGSSRKRVGGKVLTHVTSVVDVQAREVWFKVKAVGKREPFVLYGSVFKYYMAINAIKVFLLNPYILIKKMLLRHSFYT